MTNQEIRSKLIIAGVSNLKEFGYPQADKQNILTDEIYSQFFLNMLKENKGQSTGQVDKVIDALIAELNKP